MEFLPSCDKKVHIKKEKNRHVENTFVFLHDPRFTEGICEYLAKEIITRENNRTDLEVSDFCYEARYCMKLVVVG